MLCEDVPLGRVGEMIYAASDLPITPNGKGYITIHRDERAVFDPVAIASFNYKPFVIGHPEDDVSPENWNQLARGIIINPRRGTKDKADFLIGDILVTNKEAIRLIDMMGVREISLGYDADYEELAPGVGRQHNIVGNHGALVERGRCGPRCSIGDQVSDLSPMQLQEHKKMSKKKGFVEAIMAAFKTKDEAALATALDGLGEDGDTHIHVHAAPTLGIPTRTVDLEAELEEIENVDDEMPAWFKAHVESNNKRFDALEAALKADKSTVAVKTEDSEMSGEELSKEIDKELDKSAKFKDSAVLEDSFQETAALAEILSPGIRIPTYDRAMEPKKTMDSICKFRRASLDMAYMQPDVRAIVDDIQGSKTFDIRTMDCDSVRSLFKSAAAAKKASNNVSQFRDNNGSTRQNTQKPRGINSIEELNRLNAERYKQD